MPQAYAQVAAGWPVPRHTLRGCGGGSVEPGWCSRRYSPIVALVWLPGHEDSSSSPAPGELVRYRLEGAPQPIAVGSGAAWASLSGVDEGGTFAKGIWRIDSRTGALREVPGTIGALWPAVGEGGVWVTCNAESCGGPMVLQLDPAGGGVERSIPLPDRAAQITIGLGRVWVTLGDGGIVGVDPATGEIDRRIEGGFDLIGSDGEALWATTLGGGSPGVVRLDPETGEQLASYDFPDPCNLEVSGGYVFVASLRRRHARRHRERRAGRPGRDDGHGAISRPHRRLRADAAR